MLVLKPFEMADFIESYDFPRIVLETEDVHRGVGNTIGRIQHHIQTQDVANQEIDSLP